MGPLAPDPRLRFSAQFGGDNVHGFIFREDTTEQVARMGDDSIYDCRVSFQRYDYLPWFYSN